jgi:formaldehyde-activating enzyme involved in methanogenesis
MDTTHREAFASALAEVQQTNTPLLSSTMKGVIGVPEQHMHVVLVLNQAILSCRSAVWHCLHP